MSGLPAQSTRTTIRYWVYSPGGDALFHSADCTEAQDYAAGSTGRRLECVVETITRTPLPVREAAQ